MIFATKDLLVNFLFIILPLLLVQTFSLLKYKYRIEELKKWIFLIVPAISIILCMLFPIAIDDQYIWDLRAIPFIIGGLYGGYKLGGILLAIILVVRFLLGGDGFYVIVFSYSILFLLLLTISKYYLKLTLIQKLLACCSLIFVSIVTKLIFLELFFDVAMDIFIWSQYIASNVICMFFTTILWEVIRTNLEVLEKIIKAEKLETVSHLAASISHEVRNPLTITRGFVQLLSDEDTSKNSRERYIGIALEELDRATEIINDYLTFARPVLEKKEKINVLDEIVHTVKIIIPFANMNGVNVRFPLINNANIFVIGERKKFQQCLINILKNGVESMQKGGELEIDLTSLHPYIQINIRDEGKGMTQEQINRLGEPYFTTKEKGTGLGMMVSYSIIRGMEGEIDVESQEGKGTCFSIKLPIVHSQIG
ncbi:ATP-binding protein [Jeotgalibacillus soli]|uniref:histidine kinase n=1 Tax=Jeotgalibacillus soli TaxID=889306 RepID=A0A0C2VMR1_9BACL|nr:ATP-binding protein [Jeotgalibacillus soli]KIL45293.1 histidine kinase [Jeotgalibacillus soli]